MELGKVGGLHRPVVHLRVDVDGVVGAPRGAQVLVPNALEVGGLGAGPGAGDNQIAAVLVQQGVALGVHVLVPAGQALHGGHLVLVGAKVHGNPVEVGLVVLHVALAQGFKALGSGGV